MQATPTGWEIVLFGFPARAAAIDYYFPAKLRDFRLTVAPNVDNCDNQNGSWQAVFGHTTTKSAAQSKKPQPLLLKQREKAAQHLTLIASASEYMNLTRIIDPRQAAIKHVYDSVAPWRHFQYAKKVLDAGTADELLESKNFGMTSLTEVREKLRQFGLTLRGD